MPFFSIVTFEGNTQFVQFLLFTSDPPPRYYVSFRLVFTEQKTDKAITFKPTSTVMRIF